MAGSVSVLAGIVAATVPEIASPKLVGAAATVCLLISSYAVWATEREARLRAENELRLARERNSAQAYEWAVDFSGVVADMKVLAETEARFAVALGVTITNRSTKPLSLRAELLAQWAHPFLHHVASSHETPIAAWEKIVMAFRLPERRQLTFPLNLGTGSISGHVVFDIPTVGLAVASAAGDVIGGLRDDDEGEREREYRLVILDDISLERKEYPVSQLIAPRLDGSDINDYTDLAVAGRAWTYVVHDVDK